MTSSRADSFGIRMVPRNQMTGEGRWCVAGTIGRRLSARELRVIDVHVQLAPSLRVTPWKISQCRFWSVSLTSGAPVIGSALVEM